MATQPPGLDSPPPSFVHTEFPGEPLWVVPLCPQRRVLRNAHLMLPVAPSSSLSQQLGGLLDPPGGSSPRAAGL